jgi:hypothetical protein
MRLASAAVIITFLGGVGAQAQQPLTRLVEFARQERARREAQTGSTVPLLTTESVQGLRGRVGQVRSEAAVQAPGRAPGPENPEGSLNGPEPAATEDPAAALMAGRAEVQALEDEEVRLQLDLNRLRGEFLAPVASQGIRDRAREGMGTTEARLDAVRVELVQARETLAALREAAAAAASAVPEAETAANR